MINMNINWNKKYTTRALYALIVICLSILFSLVVFNFNDFSIKIKNFFNIFKPFLIGGVIAYLLNFILKFYESRLSKVDKISGKNKRSISIVLTYITTFFMLGLFTYFVLPQLIDSVRGLVNDIPAYVENTSKFMNSVMNQLNISPEIYSIAIDKWNEVLKYILEFCAGLLPVVGELLKTTASGLWNIILGLIISVYILIEKDRFKALSKKVILAIFEERTSNRIIELTQRSNNIFGKFISGKIIDSAIIMVLTFIVLKLTNMPYTVLISVIIGITNIIPFFGPFFGAIPSTLIIMFVSPVKALWFILIIIIIQQLDGNVIGPKILGDSLGISAFWILFALLVAGKIFGVVGMIIGVPAFAVVYSIIKENVEEKLRKKGLPEDTKHYL